MEEPQAQEQPEPQSEPEYHRGHCAFHPNVETRLACGKCGQYICPRCIVQTPVGARCRDCVKMTRHPTFDITPSYYLRTSLTGGVVALVGGLLWGLVLSLHVPFLPWLSAFGVGYLVGEAVSVSSNRKRGPGLSVVAGASMTLAVMVSLVSSTYLVYNLFGLLSVGLAFYTAIARVR